VAHQQLLPSDSLLLLASDGVTDSLSDDDAMCIAMRALEQVRGQKFVMSMFYFFSLLLLLSLLQISPQNHAADALCVGDAMGMAVRELEQLSGHNFTIFMWCLGPQLCHSKN
jgi:hypothetical protein